MWKLCWVGQLQARKRAGGGYDTRIIFPDRNVDILDLWKLKLIGFDYVQDLEHF